MAKAVYRASVRGARRVGFSLSRAGKQIQTVLLDEFAGNLAPTLTRIGRAFAPHDTGRLERGLKARVGSRGGRITVTLESTAKSDEGFPYTQATRTGRKAIRPKRAKVLRFPAPGRGPGFIFTKFVRAWRPAGDWVERAEGGWDQEFDKAADRIGREIVTRLL